MGSDAVEEPAVVGDHHSTAGKILKTFLKRTDCVYIHIIGRLVEKQHVTLILESQGKVKTVPFTTGEDAAEFFRRAQNYRNIFNPENGWMNRRAADGAFAPFTSKYDQKGCVESNIYQQTWFVPHDIDGLVQLMGKERFVRELDEFFEKADLSAFWNDDYNHSNEPVHTVPHIFNRIGQPEKTQYWVRRIQKESYRPGPYGYCGNEDVGQMSAWFVLTAMGMHQSCLASNEFELNTPLFPRVSLTLDPACHACTVARTLTISTDCDPETHPYVASVELNGTPLGRMYVTWDELTAGGELMFRLIDRPQRT